VHGRGAVHGLAASLSGLGWLEAVISEDAKVIDGSP
jgi:hypothetical protein